MVATIFKRWAGLGKIFDTSTPALLQSVVLHNIMRSDKSRKPLAANRRALRSASLRSRWTVPSSQRFKLFSWSADTVGGNTIDAAWTMRRRCTMFGTICSTWTRPTRRASSSVRSAMSLMERKPAWTKFWA